MDVSAYAHAFITRGHCCCTQACKFITGTMAINTETLGKDTLLNAAKTCMSSKIIGADEAHFSSMAVAAVQAVKTVGPSGTVRLCDDPLCTIPTHHVLYF